MKDLRLSKKQKLRKYGSETSKLSMEGDQVLKQKVVSIL
jgi:hypothetical protein